MTLPAPAITGHSGTVAVLDVDALLSRLPAEDRAEVVWAKRPIEVSLARLRAGSLTESLLDEVARDVWAPMAVIARALWQAVGSSPEEWRAKLVEDLRRDEERLRVFLPDDDARDTLDWVAGFLKGLFDCTFAVALPSLPLQLEQEDVERLAGDADLCAFVRGQVSLMAALDAEKAGVDPERARDLVDLSFLELVRVRNLLRGQGQWFSAFPQETTEERRSRALSAAERLRSAMTDDDWDVVEAARMRDLR